MRIRETLAIIADIATILGVSIVWFVGTPLVAVLLGRKLSLFSLVNGVLFYFIIFGTAILISSVLLRKCWRLYFLRQYLHLGFTLLLYLISLTILAGIIGPSRDVWANLLGNEYLFPPSPTEVIEGLDIRYSGDEASIVGKVRWKLDHQVDTDNYRVIAYLKYRDEAPFYKIHKFFTPIDDGGTSETQLARINADGSFVIPNVSISYLTQGNVFQGCIVAIITKLDGWPFRRIYPPGVTAENSTELLVIHAFAKTEETAH